MFGVNDSFKTNNYNLIPEVPAGAPLFLSPKEPILLPAERGIPPLPILMQMTISLDNSLSPCYNQA